MKKLLFIAAVLLCSCTREPRTVKNVGGTSFDVVEVDSCEYIIGCAGYKGYMAHKGNCKYCEQRRNHELEIIRNYEK